MEVFEAATPSAPGCGRACLVGADHRLGEGIVVRARARERLTMSNAESSRRPRGTLSEADMPCAESDERTASSRRQRCPDKVRLAELVRETRVKARVGPRVKPPADAVLKLPDREIAIGHRG